MLTDSLEFYSEICRINTNSKLYANIFKGIRALFGNTAVDCSVF
jgi:hypothetical protein